MAERSATSGRVFRLRIDAIILERVVESTISAMADPVLDDVPNNGNEPIWAAGDVSTPTNITDFARGQRCITAASLLVVDVHSCQWRASMLLSIQLDGSKNWLFWGGRASSARPDAKDDVIPGLSLQRGCRNRRRYCVAAVCAPATRVIQASRRIL